MKLIYLLAWFCFIIPAFAVEIGLVTRDFFYPNIFQYKDRLIGASEVNRFSFSGTFEKEDGPEIFIVHLYPEKEEMGDLVTVIFQYKTDHQKNLKEIRKEILLSEKKIRLPFHFSQEQNTSEGRVELWTIKIIKNSQVIAEKKSYGNQWRD